MVPSAQPFGIPAVPPNVTVLEPADCVPPKFAPVIVTAVPYLPVVGDTLEIVGAGIVNAMPLLAWPFTVTTTLPVVEAGTLALMLPIVQELIGAVTPLNLTVLDP